jgi:hypothetical protein
VAQRHHELLDGSGYHRNTLTQIKNDHRKSKRHQSEYRRASTYLARRRRCQEETPAHWVAMEAAPTTMSAATRSPIVQAEVPGPHAHVAFGSITSFGACAGDFRFVRDSNHVRCFVAAFVTAAVSGCTSDAIRG